VFGFYDQHTGSQQQQQQQLYSGDRPWQNGQGTDCDVVTGAPEAAVEDTPPQHRHAGMTPSAPCGGGMEEAEGHAAAVMVAAGPSAVWRPTERQIRGMRHQRTASGPATLGYRIADSPTTIGVASRALSSAATESANVRNAFHVPPILQANEPRPPPSPPQSLFYHCNVTCPSLNSERRLTLCLCVPHVCSSYPVPAAGN